MTLRHIDGNATAKPSPEYLARGLYIFQAERAFRGGLTHMAFYANGAIQVQAPRIRHREDLVAFTHDEARARQSRSETDRLIGAAIEVDLHAGTREEGKQYQVLLLSAPDDPDTDLLPHPIINDTTAESGRPWAWTMGQRYVSLAGVTRPGASVTSDLDAG